MAAWVLSLLLFLQPEAPWRASYPATARAIAEAAERSEPLIAGPDGRARTATTSGAAGAGGRRATTVRVLP